MHIPEPSNTPPVEIFPWMAYVPSFMAEWKRRAARVRKGMYGIYFQTLDAAKAKMERGDDRFSTLFSHLLRQRQGGGKVGFTDPELAFMGGGLLDGAIDTTLSSVESLILCLTAHKDVQRRAQDEVDRVCGGRPPRPDDIQKLSYLYACMMEVSFQTRRRRRRRGRGRKRREKREEEQCLPLFWGFQHKAKEELMCGRRVCSVKQVFRWRGAANVGVPHCTTEDDEFEGYVIPKDTTIIACSYSMHMREEDYDEPQRFDPDRYVGNAYGVAHEVGEDEGRRATYAFGVGRRMCPGDDFARMIILMAASKLLWAFDFDTWDGRPPDLSWETGYRSGLTNPPDDFAPKMTPRSDEKAAAVVEEYKGAEDYLATWFG